MYSKQFKYDSVSKNPNLQWPNLVINYILIPYWRPGQCQFCAFNQIFGNFLLDLKIYSVILRKVKQGRNQSKPSHSPVDIQFREKILFKQSFGGTKLVNGFEKSKHLEKLKLFV